MRRTLSYVPAPGHLLLLLLAILMRLPALLFPDYFLPEESLFLACAERISGDYALYADAWYEGPPLLVWLYSGFFSLFGSWAISAIRISTALYVYLLAAMFQGTLVLQRLQERRRYTPGLFLVVLLSLPWYGLSLSTALLSLLPLGYMMLLILKLTQDEVASRSSIFYAGLLLAALIMTDYSGIVLIIASLIAYIFLRGFRVPELVIGVIGMLLGLFMVIAWLYLHDALGSYVDIGLLSYFRYIFSKAPSPFDPDLGVILTDIILNYGPWMILGGFGLFHFRVKLFSYSIVGRRIEAMMLIWLIFGTIILIFSGSRLQIHDLALIAAPIAFYAARAWDLTKGIWLRMLSWGMIIIPAMLLYLDMFSAWQGSWTVLPGDFRAWIGVNYLEIKDLEKIRTLQLPETSSLWVADPTAQLYPALDKKPASPFVDFRSAFHKIPYINPDLARSSIADAYLFETFAQDMPDKLSLTRRHRSGASTARFFPTQFRGL
ncbi:MAG: hypothetical protein R3B47_12570 [Bacteroidia bacterium]